MEKGNTEIYSNLTAEQIQLLEKNGNKCNDWLKFRLPAILLNDTNVQEDERGLNNIVNCTFNGTIFIQYFTGCAVFDKKIRCELSSGLRNSNFFGIVKIGANTVIDNCWCISNCSIGKNCVLMNCPHIICDENGFSLGIQSPVEIGSEKSVLKDATYNRHVNVTAELNYSSLGYEIFKFAKIYQSEIITPRLQYETIIEQNSRIFSSEIKNCFVGKNSLIGSSNISDSTLSMDSQSDSLSAVIVESSRIVNSMVSCDCEVTEGASLQKVYMFPFSSVSHHATVVESILAPDSSISLGECYNSILGPFVGFHHQSLLISTVWLLGRGNLGYGAMVGANHTGRSNDQECLMGEGCFIGLNTAVKFPCNLLRSPYTIIAAGTVLLPQRIGFPFSLIVAPEANLATYSVFGSLNRRLSPGLNKITPCWILQENSYFVERSMDKFAKRGKSASYSTDWQIHRPSIARMVFHARNKLQNLHGKCSDKTIGDASAESVQKMVFTESHDPDIGKCFLEIDDIPRAIDAYHKFLQRYALHGLLYYVCVVTTHAAAFQGKDFEGVQSLQRRCSRAVDSMSASIDQSKSPYSDKICILDMIQDTIDCDRISHSNDAMGCPNLDFHPLLRDLLVSNKKEKRLRCRNVLITDSFNESVLVDQMQLLVRDAFISTEFNITEEDVRLTAVQPDHEKRLPSSIGKALQYLVEIEEIFAKKVLQSKQKDNIRANKIIPDYQHFFTSETAGPFHPSPSSEAISMAAMEQCLLDSDEVVISAQHRHDLIKNIVKQL